MTETPSLLQKVTTTCIGLLGAATALASLAMSSCAPAQPRIHAQDAVIRVESDPGVPIAGATVVFAGRTLTHTTADGRAQLHMTGKDGDVFHLTVGCPQGFQPAAALEFDILVRRTDEATTIPEFGARCVKAMRRAVIAVRASNGPNLPVLHLGREIGRTDPSGATTLALDVKPGADIELVLDTHDFKKLHPQNPVLSFKAKDQDDIFALDQSFTIDKPIIRRVVARGPSIPKPLGGRSDD